MGRADVWVFAQLLVHRRRRIENTDDERDDEDDDRKWCIAAQVDQ